MFWKGSFLALGPWLPWLPHKGGHQDWHKWLESRWRMEGGEFWTPPKRNCGMADLMSLQQMCLLEQGTSRNQKKTIKKTWPYYQLPHETKSQDIKAEYPTHFPSSHQPSFESTVVIHSIPQHAVSPDSLFPIIPIPMLHFTFVSFLLPLQKSWTLLFRSCIGLFNLARQAALEQNSAFGVDPDFRPLVMGQWDMK